jgi:hypothetical protein
MFIENKYYKWYYNIIARARSRIILPNFYYEKHHVVPKSLNGSDDISNIVKLTAKEHFVCHMLLIKFTEGKNRNKMAHAFWRMCHPKKNSNNTIPSAKIYDIAKKMHIEALKSLRGESHPNFGKKHPERTSDTFTKDWKQNISNSKKGLVPWNKGIPRTDEVKNAVSKANTGKIPWNKGSRWDEDTIKKISDGNKGKKWIHDNNGNNRYVSMDVFANLLADGWIAGIGERKKAQYLKCQHCDITIDPGNYKRLHGDKCKNKI